MGEQTFSAKGQGILGFVGFRISVATTQFSFCSIKQQQTTHTGERSWQYSNKTTYKAGWGSDAIWKVNLV